MLVQWAPWRVTGSAVFEIRSGHRSAVERLTVPSGSGLTLVGAPEVVRVGGINGVELASVDLRLGCTELVRLDDTGLPVEPATLEALAPHVSGSELLAVAGELTPGGAGHTFVLDQRCSMVEVPDWVAHLAQHGRAELAYDLLLAPSMRLPAQRDSVSGLPPEASVDGYPRLLALAQRAAQLIPDRIEAHLRCGWLLGELGRPAEAVPHLERAIAVGPDTGDVDRAWTSLGHARSALGDWPGALAALVRARERRKNAVTGRNLGIALAHVGRFDEAEPLRRHRASGLACVEAAAAMARLGQRDLARALLRVGLTLDPDPLEPDPPSWWSRQPDLSWAGRDHPDLLDSLRSDGSRGPGGSAGMSHG